MSTDRNQREEKIKYYHLPSDWTPTLALGVDVYANLIRLGHYYSYFANEETQWVVKPDLSPHRLQTLYVFNHDPMILFYA